MSEPRRVLKNEDGGRPAVRRPDSLHRPSGQQGVSQHSPRWLASIPDKDRGVYELAGFANRVGFGKRPAVLVIDLQYRTAGDHPAPIEEAITTMYPTACGEPAWEAVGHVARLLEAAREKDVPIIYPYVAPKREVDAGRFGQINPLVTSIPERGYQFIDEIAPREGDVLLPKRHASAFFGTALASYLVDFGADTVLVTGATTGGCVRATVADAFSYNFHTIVVEECVFDRIRISHDISLFDMDAKYADVVPVETAITYLRSLDR